MNENVAKNKMEGIILSYLLLTRLEELKRENYATQKDKQIINRTIRHLKGYEVLFDNLDETAGMDKVDTVVNEFEKFTTTLSKVPFEYYKTIYEEIQNDILK